MKYVTKKQHRTRYINFPVQHPNAYLPKHNLEFNGMGEDFDPGSLTAEQFAALAANLDSTQFDAMEFDFKWDLNLTGTVLDIKFINVTEDNRIISHLSADMNYIKDADAGSLWYINDDTVAEGVNQDDRNADMVTLKQSDFINSLAATLPTRDFNILGRNSLIAFYVSKDNPTPDDIVVIIVRPVVSTDSDYNEILPEMIVNNIEISEGEGDNRVTVTGNLTKHPSDPLKLMMFELLPEITVTSSTVSGDVITVNFTTDEQINNIYLVQDSGYLPKTKIPVTNGAGTFKVVTTGMDPGDTVRVKMGFKYWVSRNDFTRTL